MITATYEFYTKTYCGNEIAEPDFPRLSARAAAYLDGIKRRELPDSDNVKMAICAVAEVWQQNENGGELTSQTVGSWSQSYAASNKSASQRMFEAARLYIPDLISSVRWV